MSDSQQPPEKLSAEADFRKREFDRDDSRAAFDILRGIAEAFTAGSSELTGPTGASMTAPQSNAKPSNYYQMTDVVRAGYRDDPLFSYLIRRAVHFGGTPTKLRVFDPVDAEVPKEMMEDPTFVPTKPKTLASQKEQDIWDWWGEDAFNADTANALPGLMKFKEVNLQNLLLDGMSTVVLEMGRKEFGASKGSRVEVVVPIRYTTIPATLIALTQEYAQQNLIPQERIYVNTSSRVDISKAPPLAPQDLKGYASVRPLEEFEPSSLRPRSRPTTRQFGTALKYMHSPSDPSTVGISATQRRGGTNQSILYGLYPTPPFVGLQSALKIRSQGAASDLSVLDGLIRQILWISIGNKDAPILPDQVSTGGQVREGTMKQVSKLLATENTGQVMQLLLPWYIELKKLETDPSSLMSYDKYLHATLSILAAFGILVAPPNVREVFAEINQANFEEFLDNLVRNHHSLLVRTLTRRMMSWNSKTLTLPPLVYDLPMNTKAPTFVQSLFDLKNLGEVSTATVLEGVGLDSDYERATVARELITGRKHLEDANVPVSLVQRTQGAEDDSETSRGGRKTPGTGTQGDGNKTKQSKPSGKRTSGNRVQRKPRT